MSEQIKDAEAGEGQPAKAVRAEWQRPGWWRLDMREAESSFSNFGTDYGFYS